MSPPTCIIIPLHAKVFAEVVGPTSTPSHCSRSLGYDHHVRPFVDVEVEECIKYVSEKIEEEEMKTIGVFTEILCMVLH